MPTIFVCVHPIHDPVRKLSMYELWDLYIHGVLAEQLNGLVKINTNFRIINKIGRVFVVACEIFGNGTGSFPLKRNVKPFLKEIQEWGFKESMCHPAGDSGEFSMCTFSK